MIVSYMSFAQCVEYLHTTVFDDEISMKITVIDVADLDAEGIPIEEKYGVKILLSDGMGYEKLILLKKVRDKSPYYFRSLDKIFNDLLWRRDSCLCMAGNLPLDFYEKEYFND